MKDGEKYICEIKAIYGNGSYIETLTYDGYHDGFFHLGAFFSMSNPKQNRLTVLRKADENE